MSAVQILNRARSAGVRLWVVGDRLRYKGPSEAVERLLPELAAHKSEILAYLQQSANPGADDSRARQAPPLSPERAAGLLSDLRDAITRLSEWEGWPEQHRDYLLGLMERQPSYTLAGDLAYFRERLSAIEAVVRSEELAGRVLAEHDAIRKCSTCAHRTVHSYGVAIRCARAAALTWRHHDWLEAPDALNLCPQHEPKRGKA